MDRFNPSTCCVFCVVQFPQELVTYGGNGQVFSNWAQVSPESMRVFLLL